MIQIKQIPSALNIWDTINTFKQIFKVCLIWKSKLL